MTPVPAGSVTLSTHVLDATAGRPAAGVPVRLEHRGPSFYPEVTVTFEMTGEGGHYHVPLLLSPYAYSTYRGS